MIYLKKAGEHDGGKRKQVEHIIKMQQTSAAASWPIKMQSSDGFYTISWIIKMLAKIFPLNF